MTHPSARRARAPPRRRPSCGSRTAAGRTTARRAAPPTGPRAGARWHGSRRGAPLPRAPNRHAPRRGKSGHRPSRSCLASPRVRCRGLAVGARGRPVRYRTHAVRRSALNARCRRVHLCSAGSPRPAYDGRGSDMPDHVTRWTLQPPSGLGRSPGACGRGGRRLIRIRRCAGPCRRPARVRFHPSGPEAGAILLGGDRQQAKEAPPHRLLRPEAAALGDALHRAGVSASRLRAASTRSCSTARAGVRPVASA